MKNLNINIYLCYYNKFFLPTNLDEHIFANPPLPLTRCRIRVRWTRIIVRARTNGRRPFEGTTHVRPVAEPVEVFRRPRRPERRRRRRRPFIILSGPRDVEPRTNVAQVR